MEFDKTYFNPEARGGQVIDQAGTVAYGTASAPGGVYLYTPETLLALNVARAIGRPLLISGEPGSGKTTLARNAASVLGWWFYKETVTSRTKATDLLWTFDTLRRLNDAQERGEQIRPRQYYVEPGRLWWAFDPEAATHRGRRERLADADRLEDPGLRDPGDVANHAVVLIDEIDKADPDVPNDLLEPFDVGGFTVRETNDRIERTRDVLLILTTNSERELPPAFLRRCVTLALSKKPEEWEAWFVAVAQRRYGNDLPLFGQVAREVVRWREAARNASVRAPGTAEYLDAVAACLKLKVDPASAAWAEVAGGVLWKYDQPPTF
jgi:MoxR-like ATPase